jgi:hypothetical protein
MDLKDIIIQLLSKNYNPELYKSDKRIKTAAIRIINEFITYNLIHLDDKGKIFNKEYSKLEQFPNFELLIMIENSIISAHEDKFANSLIITIQSLDYLGKCWYTPLEVAKALELITQKRHNKNKIKNLLEDLCKEGICIKLTNLRFDRLYRILYVPACKEKAI